MWMAFVWKSSRRQHDFLWDEIMFGEMTNHQVPLFWELQ